MVFAYVEMSCVLDRPTRGGEIGMWRDRKLMGHIHVLVIFYKHSVCALRTVIQDQGPCIDTTSGVV